MAVNYTTDGVPLVRLLGTEGAQSWLNDDLVDAYMKLICEAAAGCGLSVAAFPASFSEIACREENSEKYITEYMLKKVLDSLRSQFQLFFPADPIHESIPGPHLSKVDHPVSASRPGWKALATHRCQHRRPYHGADRLAEAGYRGSAQDPRCASGSFILSRDAT